jgi:hypothetical protein
MPGLEPGIHGFRGSAKKEVVDARPSAKHDERE